MSVEGKNFISNLSGKFSIDFKPCAYFNVKKMSIEENGASVCDVDVIYFFTDLKVILLIVLLIRFLVVLNICQIVLLLM